jgi:hypothetical protein
MKKILPFAHIYGDIREKRFLDISRDLLLSPKCQLENSSVFEKFSLIS